jgi:outer membrane protein TolC
LASAREAVDYAERGVRYAGNQLLPQLDVNVALTRRDTVERFSQSFRFDDLRWATFFTISMPVDRTAKAVDRHNALIERDRRKRELATLRLRIVEEARRAVRQRERLVRALEVVEASVGAAEQEVEVATLRYQRGFSNNLDVVTAEGGLLAARSRRIAVLAELAVAQLRVKAATGALDPRRDFPLPEAS